MEAALRVAVETDPVLVDVGRAGDRAFMNVATGGFGTEYVVVPAQEDKPGKKAQGSGLGGPGGVPWQA